MAWFDRVKAVEAVVTSDILEASMPDIEDADEWAEAFNKALNQLPVDDLAMLLAQIGHESMDLTVLEENLYYTAERLVDVWPKRYEDEEAAAPYARDPEELANHTYGNRLGNDGSEDGWRYRGRGPLQLTGEDNYEEFEDATGIEVTEDPDLLIKDKEIAILSACWFFRTYVTATSVEEVTRQIQGGQLGLGDRRDRYKRTRDAMRRGE